MTESRIDVRRATIALATLIAFAAALAFVTSHHEPWRDEADAWLVARDEGFASMWRLGGYGGGLGLWFFLLAPFAKSGAPYWSALAVNDAVVIAAAGILLLRGPYPLIFKILILASYPLFFEYGVIARSYGLTTLLLFATAAALERRGAHPVVFGIILALLCNSSTPGLFCGVALMLPDAVALISGSRWERALMAPLTIGACGAVVAALELAVVHDGFVDALPPFDHMAALSYFMRNSVVPTEILQAFGLPVDATVLNVLLMLSGLFVLRSHPRSLLFYAAATASLVYIYAFHYRGSLRHVGLQSIVLVVAYWMSCDERRGVRSLIETAYLTLLAVALFVSALLNIGVCRLEIQYAFSGSAETSSFIIDHGFGSRTIAAFPDQIASAVLPYLPQRSFWYAGARDFGSHMAWTAEYERSVRISYPEAFRRIQAHKFPGGADPLILFSEPIPSPERLGYRLLHENAAPIFGQPEERYFLYERVSSRYLAP